MKKRELIPYLDMDAQYKSIKGEIQKAIEEVLEDKDFIQGKHVDQFAKTFSEVHGSKYTIGCSNGTSAITVALKSLGIHQDDEVITVVNTFFATVEAIVDVGGRPVLVDCDPKTYNIDPAKIEKAITKKTKAIMPVHLYGNPANMSEIMDIARKHNLKVIEDCAQAHMANIGEKPVGSFGDVGTFSFYPGKNLGAYGDAGGIVTSDKSIFDFITKYVNHGRSEKYFHDFAAGNYRMDGIQAAILNVKLRHLGAWTDSRIEKAKYYDRAFKSMGIKVIDVEKGAKCVYHIYAIEIDNRDELSAKLKAEGIGNGIHYPVPLHMQPALKYLGYKKGDFKEAERIADRILSLPIYPELTEKDMDTVIKVVRDTI